MIKRDSKYIGTMIFLFLVLNGLFLIWNKIQAQEYWHSWALDQQERGHIHMPSQLSPIKKNIIIGVVDTGIDPQQPHLKNNLVNIKGKKASNGHYGKDFSFGTHTPNQPSDDHGHGTHIAGIIKSVFPQVKMLALKYYNPNASGRDNLNSTLQALQAAIDANVDIINYSGGGPEASVEELRILKQAEAKGILIVVASGNEGQNLDHGGQPYYPASYKLSNVITVTTHDTKDNMHPTSNWGTNTVDIAAPGDRIKSTLPYGRAGFLTGTSQATAFVSGVAGMIKARMPHLSAKELKKMIIESARPVVALKDKCKAGGALHAGAAWQLAYQSKQDAALARTVASDAPKLGQGPKIIYRLKHNR